MCVFVLPSPSLLIGMTDSNSVHLFSNFQKFTQFLCSSSWVLTGIEATRITVFSLGYLGLIHLKLKLNLFSISHGMYGARS